MARSSRAERVERINAARKLIQRDAPFAEATDTLCRRFGISRRQAYRYIEEALRSSQELAVPEPKAVFTGKWPVGLIEQLRSFSRPPGQSLSDFVAEMLSRSLRRRKERGQR
jgi:hypothetical protein